MISAIVLAAGEGKRFGGTKQVERLRGKPLAQHAVDAANAAGLDEIVVVLGHDAELVRDALDLPVNARTVVNDRYPLGQSTSLAAGIRAVSQDSEAVVVLLADQPGITREHVGALVEAFGLRRSSIVRLAFRDGPGPSLLSREVWDEALRLEGDVGARALIERHPDRIQEVALDEDVPADVDVPDDLPRA